MIKELRLWLLKYKLHILIWVLYMLYEYVMVTLLFGQYGSPWPYLSHFIIIIALFYAHADLLLPYMLANKYGAAWKLPLLLSVELALYLLFAYGDDQVLVQLHLMQLDHPLRFDYLYVARNLYRGLYFIGFGSGYYFLMVSNQEKHIRQELERRQLQELIDRQRVEQELTRAQNAFLKAQINPHFLFNTLDFIYHNIMETAPAAAEAIITLSEMMRFAIDADKMGEFVLIGEESEQVTNLAYLNQVRKQEPVNFVFNCAEDAVNLPLIPLVLLTLAENIFKHGDLSSGQVARMDINLKNGILTISSENRAARSPDSLRHGTGLANIRERLLYAYGNHADLSYHTNEYGIFSLLLMVPIAHLDGHAASLKASTNIGI